MIYMPIVRMDERGRIQLPMEARIKLGLKPKQPLKVDLQRETLSVRKLEKVESQNDPVLREFTKHPLKGGKFSKKLLDEIEDTMWLP